MVVFVLVAVINMRHLLAARRKMSNLLLIVAILIGPAMSGPVSAQAVLPPLSKSEIQALMFGQRLSGEYSTGAAWSERLNRNFTSNYTDADRSLQGAVAFRNNLLCFTYPDSALLPGGCFEVWKRGANCFDFYGASDPVSLKQRQWGQAWQARAWIVGQTGTCPGEPIS
jgi:hypothetical protein